MPEFLENLVAFAGRLHPLVLHLPIGLVGALIVVEAWRLWRGERDCPSVSVPLVWLTALSGAFAVVSGLLLALEPGYGGITLDRHRLLGIALGVVMIGLAFAFTRGREVAAHGARVAYRGLLLLSALLLVPVGHLGASMTHGEDFLTAPFAAKSEPERRDSGVALASNEGSQPAGDHGDPRLPAHVKAILTRTCTSCHGESRSKGLLSLHTFEAISAGGEHGAVIDLAKPEESELLIRLRLPVDDDDHMPPANKPQPTEEEIATLVAWVHAAASGKPMLVEGDAAGAESAKANATAASTPRETTTPPQPDAKAIATLREKLVHVQPMDESASLLWIDFAATPNVADAEVAALLVPVAEFVGDLSLARTAVGDGTLALVRGMPKLRRLDLRGTRVTDAGVRELTDNDSIEELILAATAVGDGSLDAIRSMKRLTRLYAWKTTFERDSLVKLRGERPNLLADADESVASAALETEPALTFSSDAPLPGATPAPAAASLAPVNAICPVSGAAVNSKFVIVWEGRAVGFCCEKCAAAFWADPAKYVGAIAPAKAP